MLDCVPGAFQWRAALAALKSNKVSKIIRFFAEKAKEMQKPLAVGGGFGGRLQAAKWAAEIQFERSKQEMAD